MINDYARNSDVLVWTEDHLKTLVEYLNTNVLSNENNLYKKKLNEIATDPKRKKSGVVPTGMSIGLKNLTPDKLNKVKNVRLQFLKNFTSG